MKNKGFTLIELLAVIVILAIIALIATPVILGIIEDARTNAKHRTAELVYTGVQYAYTTALYRGTSGTSVGTPDGTAIAAAFAVDNATPKNATSTGFDVETNDGVYCTVTVGSGDVKVKCGSTAGAGDLLTEKSAIKPLSNPTTPQS